jgi:hypothetical protein
MILYQTNVYRIDFVGNSLLENQVILNREALRESLNAALPSLVDVQSVITYFTLSYPYLQLIVAMRRDAQDTEAVSALTDAIRKYGPTVGSYQFSGTIEQLSGPQVEGTPSPPGYQPYTGSRPSLLDRALGITGWGAGALVAGFAVLAGLVLVLRR